MRDETVVNEWWRSFYDAEFTDLLNIWKDEAELTATIAFLVEKLAISAGTTIFDQCCGVGSLSIPLAKLGSEIIGVDLGADFIKRANQQAAELKLNCRFYCEDAFEFSPAKLCDAAVNWHTCFGYTNDDERNLAMLARVFNGLKNGGRFALDYPNMAGLMKSFQPIMIRRFTTDKGDILLIRESRLELLPGMLTQEWTTILPDGRRQSRSSAVRIYLPHALADLLKRCGFSDVKLYGSINGEPLNIDSPRCICIATK